MSQCLVMFIDRAGWPFIGIALAPAVVSVAAGFPGAAVALSGLALAVALFFRDPDRRPPRTPGVVVSPADGRVLSAGPAEQSHAPPGTWQQISIFLSPLDVHVNRIPIAGTITKVDHVPGMFLRAYRHDAAAENERTEIWLDHREHTIVFRQVVGALARRVVCRAGPGSEVRTGERFGIMKFGSRMDLFLPIVASLTVTPGQRVRGGETVVARLPDEASADAGGI